MKTAYIGFRADEDVVKLIARARRKTRKTKTALIQKAIRIGLAKYAPESKEEVAA